MPYICLCIFYLAYSAVDLIISLCVQLCIQTDGRLHEVAPIPALYVYETVELELSLATISIETDESLTDYFSCPLRLNRGTAAVIHSSELVIVFVNNRSW